ncbi:MAG: hypothetical protein Q9O24_05775 [Gammaproteobacteria bacterium]|nr:hypothetical protein [Gammaproteobacteria bacterium]
MADFFTDATLRLCSWQSGYFLSKIECVNNAAGQQALADFITAKKIIILSVVFNLMDEELSLVTVPYVGFWERKKLHQRRLKKEYDDDFLTAVQFQQREMSGRKDARLLLLSLGQKEALKRCFQQLSVAGVQQFKLHSFALVCQELLDGADDSEPNVLLVSEHGDSFRQSFFVEKKLYFSRLLRFVEHEQREEQIKRELKITRQFLYSRKWLESGDALSVQVLEWPKLAQFGKQDRDPLYLCVPVVLAKTATPDYRLEAKRGWLEYKPFLRYGVLLMFLLMPLGVVESVLLMQAGDSLALKNAALQKSLPAEKRIEGVNGAQIRTWVQRTTALVAENAYSNEALFYNLSRLLQQFPAVAVDKLAWRWSEQEATIQFDGRVLSSEVVRQSVEEQYRDFLQRLKTQLKFSVRDSHGNKRLPKAGVLEVVDAEAMAEKTVSFSLLLSADRDRLQ